jgi:small subunit ribosomal protein S19
MSNNRSLKKPPFVDAVVHRMVKKAKAENSNKPIKTMARSCVITPEMIGLTIMVYNGKIYVPITISSAVVGHKLGEFVPTRKFPNHKNKSKDSK